MSKGRPKVNTTAYKAGDVILFLSDIKKDKMDTSSFVYRRHIVIPAHLPVVIEKINSSHIWVKFKGETYWIRNISNRMIPATEAAKVLFGEKNGIE